MQAEEAPEVESPDFDEPDSIFGSAFMLQGTKELFPDFNFSVTLPEVTLPEVTVEPSPVLGTALMLASTPPPIVHRP